MKKTVAFYLAGSIQKGHEKGNEIYWTADDMAFLKQGLPDYDVTFLNPAHRTDDLSDQYSVFGRDMLQVFCSDIVFVDARERRGLGVGAEMMWAKVHNKPIITLAPHNTHYRKDATTLLGVPVKDWVHPFIESLSDVLVTDLASSLPWITRFITDPPPIKGLPYIHSAMRYYRDTQFPSDLPMQELLRSPSLQTRLESLQKETYSNPAREL